MRSRLCSSMFLVLLMTLIPPSQATALFEIYQPDVFVKGGTGEGIHDPTGAGQVHPMTVGRGSWRKLPFWNRNDGNTTDTFTYWGCSGKGPFKIRWLDWTGADVSAAATAGVYTTPPLDPGWSEGMLTLYIEVRRSAVSGRHVRCTVVATSGGNNVQDRAGYKITVR